MSHEPVPCQRHRCRNAPPRVPQYSLRISAHSVFPSIDSRSNRSPASRISLWRWDSQYPFVNLKITSKSNSIVSQSHAGEDAPVSTHPHEPRTQIHPWRTLDFGHCFFCLFFLGCTAILHCYCSKLTPRSLLRRFWAVWCRDRRSTAFSG